MENNTSALDPLMNAIFTTPGTEASFTIRKTAIPVPAPHEALIKVNAFSLNQGETRTALAATGCYTPGWDFAGVIVKAATNGSTPPAGTRVFGYIAKGSWAEYLACPGGLMAEIPEAITAAQAACLPIAGMTALACLGASGDIKDQRVLITGASGGVGRFACQIAAMAGAKVFAVSSRAELAQQLEKEGLTATTIFSNIHTAKAAGEYDIVWDAVGGDTLATALSALARNGCGVNYGNSSRQPTSLEVRATGWPLHNIRCVWLGREPLYPSTPLLEKLAEMVTAGKLLLPIDSELPWTRIVYAAQLLLQQRVNGKLVMHITE
ncbi:zinc-binding dehydrogenase [Chitinophaga sp. Hz27]|uniref:zinc-binding dehydrogenase n=1 Tax=Chitinophaga sp. Hz27 TaxID=3347169 RepID=UPI0035E39957